MGREEYIEKTKIDPLVSQAGSEDTKPSTGLMSEQVDAARIEPLGEVREEMKPSS